MIEIIKTEEHKTLGLDDYAADVKFISAVSDLRNEAMLAKPKLDGRTIWMVNSTAQGGGVAEMLPRLCSLMNELQISVKWAVLKTDNQDFFHLTKRIHNLIHGDGRGGLEFSSPDQQLYEAVSRENFDSFKPLLGPRDIVIIHDPQPLPMGKMIHDELGLKTIWRCHIGLDDRTEVTKSAWRFLKPHLGEYDHTIFSVPEYIPGFLTGRSTIIYPALDPLSHKNRDLLVDKMMGILCNSGLQKTHEPVPTPDFEHQVQRISPSGDNICPGEMGLLFRPVILQISRWDRLKGWLPLMEGFVRLKQNHRKHHDLIKEPRNRQRIELARLVLAGPDPSSIADDPEGLEVIRQIVDRYQELTPELQKDIAIVMLPMQSRKHNALIVNALQRCASIIVQNSLQEGFGLTVTEAMWKGMSVLGSTACGIRQQIRDGVDGVLTQDPTDPDEIAARLKELLVSPIDRYLMGRSAQRRSNDEFLVFRQISRYLQLLTRVV